MTLSLFFKNFEYLADAPNGIKKLRELILQLAVQGKLVPQDPNDEPASVLLGKITLEKQRLLQEGKVNKYRQLPAVTSDESSYILPNSWLWVRFGDVLLDIEAGTSPQCEKRPKQEDEWGVLKISAVSWNRFDANENKALPKGFKPNSQYEVKVDDFLMSRANTSQLVGKSVIVCSTPPRLLISDKTLRVSFPSCVDRKFFNLYSNGPVARAYYAKAGTGTSDSMRNITREQIRCLPTPFPPLEEQKRIVTKVEQLMRLCDELEERQKKRRSHLTQLNQGAIAQLLTATPDEFGDRWQRIYNNFDLLYSLPENISKLRQAILQLAVQGRLVPQDANTEPASALLASIRAEKEALISEKRISKEKSLPEIDVEELPFKVPSGWTWVRIGEISKVIEYGTSEKSSEVGGDVPVLRMNNIRDGKVLFENLKFVSDSIKDLPRLYLQHGDLLFNRTNSYELVGKTGVYQGENNQYTFASYLIRASLVSDYVMPEFINIAMNSAYFRCTQIEPEITQQCGQANFNGTKLKNAVVPLPPKGEQKQIVAKVDRLMALCDELEAKLKQTQSDSENLMEVAVRQVLAA